MSINTIIQKSINVIIYVLGIVALIGQVSCKKYLDAKRRQDLAVPTSLKDLQAVIDNQNSNGYGIKIADVVADDIYLTSVAFDAQDVEYRSTFIWNGQATVPAESWNDPYKAIYDANFILDFLPEINVKAAEQDQYNSIKGNALFARSFMFHQLAQLFCKPYSSTANTDLGIVLRLTSAVEAKSTRATVQQTYDQIIKDLKDAVELLPSKTITSFRPNKVAAYALLARVYLSMRDYVNAGTYANLSLSENSTLLDYNSLSPSGNSSIPKFADNPEILFVNYSFNKLLQPSRANIDSNLYKSYSNDDLRKNIFFGGSGASVYWKGSYMPDDLIHDVFNGLAVDEVYLIRAETYARAGNKDAALNDLNFLLRKRWKSGVFNDLTAATANDALNLILTERRKELIFRGLRWSDLRRFNLDGANITLVRKLSSNEYTLPPNDNRWVLLIPVQETSQSGIPQNPR